MHKNRHAPSHAEGAAPVSFRVRIPADLDIKVKLMLADKSFNTRKFNRCSLIETLLHNQIEAYENRPNR